MASAVDIVVPVRNEEASVEEFYARAARLGYAESLIFVDNASTDGTIARLQRCPGIRLTRHQVDEGYGASIRDGIAAGTAERIIIIDADLEYPPEAIPEIVAALDEHAVVYASRFLGPTPADMPTLRRMGNAVISGVFNVLFDEHTTDLYTGMKGIRRAALQSIAFNQAGFEHVIELAAQLVAAGHHIREIPITYTPRARGSSKMRHIPETVKYLWYVTRYWLQLRQWRRRLLGPKPRGMQ